VNNSPQRRAVFETLFRVHYRSVEAFVRSRYPSIDHDAVVSHTFEIAWRRLEEIPTEGPRGWLISVARNCARNEMRGSRRRQARLEELAAVIRIPDVEPPSISSSTLESFRVAFSRLPAPDREVLLLADWDGLIGEDLARALGVSKTAAAVRLHRARARLRTIFTDNEGLE
jgi:RNA polymerase sigma-70 factor (ECF subfamily)